MGLQNLNLSVTYVQGCDVACTSTSGFGPATDAAKKADVVIIVIGLDGGQEKYEEPSIHPFIYSFRFLLSKLMYFFCFSTLRTVRHMIVLKSLYQVIKRCYYKVLKKLLKTNHLLLY